MKKRDLFISILLAFFISAVGCARKKSPLDDWSARLLDGNPVVFSRINAPYLLLNFYSPTCVPCIEELPALHILYEKALAKGIPFYIVVEGNPESHGLPAAVTDEDAYRSIRDRLKQDVERYGIRIPVAVIDGGIAVMGSGGLITGTPETILLSTNPLTLRYNFVGPVSASHEPEGIAKDGRFQFILGKLEYL